METSKELHSDRLQPLLQIFGLGRSEWQWQTLYLNYDYNCYLLSSNYNRFIVQAPGGKCLFCNK
jgi:hypothetical protein